jgi:DNA-binding NtrC family response regulator
LKDVPFTARVIAASNRDLKKETESGHFRLDLYYRLAVIQIDIAPLRERGGDDVALLAEHFLNSFRKRLGRANVRGLSPEVTRAFKFHDWPGNVRELRNVIERALVLEEGDVISARSLPAGFLPNPGLKAMCRDQRWIDATTGSFSIPSDGISLEALEASLLKQALVQTSGNQTRAAKLLGLTRDQFRYRWKKIVASNRPRLVAVAGSHR